MMVDLGKIGGALSNFGLALNDPTAYANKRLMERDRELEQRQLERARKAREEQALKQQQANMYLGKLMANAYGADPSQTMAMLEGGVSPEFLGNMYKPKEEELMQVYDPTRKAMVFIPESQALGRMASQPKIAKPKERRIVEQGGVQYFADTGEPVIQSPLPPIQKEKDRLAREESIINSIQSAESTLKQIEELKAAPGFEAAVGSSLQKLPFSDAGNLDLPGGGFISGTDAASFAERLKQLKGGAFLQARQQLKGGGAISDTESNKAEAAVTRMSLAQSEKEFIKARDEYEGIIRKGLERAKSKAEKKGLMNNTNNTLESELLRRGL